MTDAPITVAELEDTRESMIAALVGEMPEAHRRFLISFERGEPNWDLLAITGVQDLPAVAWRQKNLASLPQEKRNQLVEALGAIVLAPKTRTAGGS